MASAAPRTPAPRLHRARRLRWRHLARTRSPRRRSLAALAAVLVSAALLVGVVGAAAATTLVHRAEVAVPFAQGEPLTILSIGSDIGPPHRPGNPLRGRADGVHLVAIDTSSQQATIVNIPRDSLIGGRKVNAHLALGGPDRLVTALEAYSGVSVDYWALTTFRGIERIYDGIQGVEVDVPHRMRDRFSGSNFAPGPQRISGWQALTFVRDRKSLPDGDVGRSRNQARLMLATHRELVARKPELDGVLQLIGVFARNIVTDLPPEQYLPMALLALQIDPADVRSVTLSGAVGATASGASVIHLQPGDTFEQIRAGHIGPPDP